MTNDEFRDIYGMLDARHRSISGAGLTSLHPGGMITFARHVRAVIEEWETEVARRAKAAAENARSTEQHVRADFGADAYDKLVPEHAYGLEFGDTINKKTT